MTPIQVHALLGNRGLPLSIKCLSSLVRTSVEPITLVLHEDGSLTKDDELLLKDSLPIDSIITRKESDERIYPLLKDYPYCTEYRRTEFMVIKLFDIPMLSGPEIYYCDTDILFMAPHRGLFAGVLDHADAVFATDVINMYSLLPWQIAPLSNTGLQKRLNAGLYAIRKSAFDVEVIERYFADFDARPSFQKRRSHVEQTAWSVLATHLNCLSYDPTQLTIGYPGFPYDPNETLGIHFVSACRNLLPDYDDKRREGEAPRDFRLVKSRSLDPISYFYEMSARVFKARLKAKFQTA